MTTDPAICAAEEIYKEMELAHADLCLPVGIMATIIRKHFTAAMADRDAEIKRLKAEGKRIDVVHRLGQLHWMNPNR